jgi:hypothetical protein
VSEIEFCTLYLVPEQWVVGCMLRFVHANNHFSDTLYPGHRIKSEIAGKLVDKISGYTERSPTPRVVIMVYVPSGHYFPGHYFPARTPSVRRERQSQWE